MNRQNIHFVTGRLAQQALRAELQTLSARHAFDFTIQVMPISVAALMNGQWIAARIEVPDRASQVVLPGYAAAGLETVQQACRVPVRIGPKDLRDLSLMFGENPPPADLSRYDIAILAEINHAPQMDSDALQQIALQMKNDGADLIDIGCDPSGRWEGIAECVRGLAELGIRTSVDSFDPAEVAAAVAAGAELVLSVNSSNVEAAADWGVEVVVVPDDPLQWQRMEDTMERLTQRGVPFRIDPVLEPVGVGFSNSLARYFAARTRWPNVPMMMGIGNLTELTDADSAAINLLLMGICQEQSIHSVLTTQVINWARTSVRECDLARRMVWHAVHHRVPAKRLSDQLVIARDPRPLVADLDFLQTIAEQVKDRNYRVFRQADGVAVIGEKQLWVDADPFVLLDRLLEVHGDTLDPSHAFYLGYEMAKAELAVQLGKRYVQDESLDWGYLTVAGPQRHRLKRRRSGKGAGGEIGADDDSAGDSRAFDLPEGD